MSHLFRSVATAALIGAIGVGAAAAEDPGTAWDVHPTLVGTTVPDISFLNEQGEPFSLRERVKAKPLILVIYRGFW